MNPLSPLTYYRRHKRSTLLLVVLIGLMTLGVCVMVRLIDSYVEDQYNARRYLSRVSTVLAVGSELDPGLVTQIRAHPDAAYVIQEKGLDLLLPPVASEYHLFGVSESDLPLLMEACDLRRKEGQLVEPSTAQIVLSDELVRALGLQIGDVIGQDVDEDLYPAITTELTLVGVLESVPSAEGPAM